MLNIPIILGTGRKGRESEKVAQFILGELKTRGVNSKIIDPRDFATKITVAAWEKTPLVKKWKNIVSRADGFIVVCPEYNHSYPGELKILLDKAYDEYKGKPFGVCTVSSGGLGGARVKEGLILLAAALNMVPINNSVYFSTVGDVFDKNGKLLDTSYIEKSKGMIDDVIWYAKKLKK